MQQSEGGVSVGGSSILIIFVLLSLTTFAALTMVSATASHRLALQVVESAEAYYAADLEAEVLFASISRVVHENPYGNIGDIIEIKTLN